MDEVHAVLESILDWDRFGLRINEKRYWTGYATTIYNVMWVIVCNVQKKWRSVMLIMTCMMCAWFVCMC